MTNFLLSISTSEILTYSLYALAGLVVLLCVIVIILKARKRKKIRDEQKTREVEGVKEQNNVRYSEDATIVDKNGDINVTLVKNDIVLQPRKMVTVSTRGPLKPGKWTVLSAYGNEEKFNIRIGLYVKEYKHGQEIILAEGDEICPTSTTIILR